MNNKGNKSQCYFEFLLLNILIFDRL